MASTSPTPRVTATGETLGEFVVGAVLAEGRLGTLHAASRARDDAPVALRIVPAELAGDDARWQRFVETATRLAQHERRHVAPVVGSGTLADGRRWIASALSEGRVLSQLLEEHPLEPAEMLAVLKGVCRALEAAHDLDVFHGDLGAASVCVSSDGEGRMRAKVLELGGAVLLDAGRSRSGPVSRDGQPYLAFDVARDLRAVGLLCFEALTGERFDEHDDEPARVSDVRPELGPHFDEPVHSMLVLAEQPESAAAAHARLVEAARVAGYDVGGAIPPAPRQSMDSQPLPAAMLGAVEEDELAAPTAEPERPRLGLVLLGVALLVLVAAVLKSVL